MKALTSEQLLAFLLNEMEERDRGITLPNYQIQFWMKIIRKHLQDHEDRIKRTAREHEDHSGPY